MTLPPEQQCAMPGCDEKAVEPGKRSSVCRSHLPDGSGDEPVTEPEESGRDLDGQQPDTSPGVEDGVYPADLVDVEQWLAWKETDDGRKVPRAPYEHPDWPDRFVDSQNPASWRALETVLDWTGKLPGYEPAFVIQNAESDEYDHGGDPFVLIDYDDARDPQTGAIHPTVREHLERAGSYADVSTSGTGVHIFCRGALPDDVKAIEAPLPAAEGFEDAEIEVYDTGRFAAMTGTHLAGTPTETTDCQALLDELAEEFATVAEGTPDELLYEPETSKDDLADVETTDDIQDVLDAIQHTGPRDIRLRSSVTHRRSDGSKSMDPSWAHSKSGTRLAQVGDGWVYRQGMIGLDALQVVALEERIVTSETDYPSGEAFWEAVDALRDRGAHVPEYEPPENEADHTAVLPDNDRLDTAASGWDWRHADVETDLTVDDARERTVAAIADAYETGDRVLVEALPTMGKSYGAVKAAADTDTPIAIFTGRGRKEQYAQIQAWGDEHGLSSNVLPSFMELCDTANGEHGEEWAETVQDWYHRGATPKQIHSYAETELGRPLPCQAHEGQECPYSSAWRAAYEDPNGDPYDVLIGHYHHAHNYKVTEGRVAVFDEFPDAYETQLFENRLQSAVSYWLSTVEAVPFEDYTDLIEHRDDQQRRADALLYFEDGGLEEDGRHVFMDGAAHAAAPLAVFTLLASEDLGNGFESADLGDVGTGAFDRRDGEVSLLEPPMLDYASGVVALDGTPTEEMWELALGERLNHREVLQEAERAEYVREALDLHLVPTTDAVKPYNSADHVNVDQDAALLEAIVDQHGEKPALITTSTAEDVYDAGVEDLVGETKHYGNVLGSNEFDDTRLGAVIGSNHYGDGYLKKWGAYAGQAVERNDEKGAELSYGAFGDRILTHMREHDTLQAAMRFGRDGHGAVVYVHTDTLPEWVPIAGEGRVLTTWSDGMRQVIDAAVGLDEWTTADIANRPGVDLTQRHVLNILEDLTAMGAVEGEVDGRGYVWRDTGIHRVSEYGEAELDPIDLSEVGDEEVQEISRSVVYTWNFLNSRAGCPDRGADPASQGSASTEAAANGGEPPPDDAD